jgi:hypothetical protein
LISSTGAAEDTVRSGISERRVEACIVDRMYQTNVR